jgi:protein SCO1/2
MPRALPALVTIFTTWRFPAFLLAVVVFSKLLLLAILVLPAGEGAVFAFAADFKRWCFGWDPATGHLQPAYVATTFLEPLLLGGATVFVWWRPLRNTPIRRPARLAPWVGAALAVVALVAVGFGAVARGGRTEDPSPAFPAEDLRTTRPAPALELVDHDGRPVTLEALRGRVVLVTAVYASCGLSCPMILAQAKRALGQLTDAERAELTVVAITLDPARDTPTVLAELARAQGVHAPLWRLATGAPARVEKTLDAWGFSRRRDPSTGVIEHANLFLLVDRAGRVAYTLTLGDLQERWLVDALRRLVAERAGAP